jgi:hypothetical protein
MTSISIESLLVNEDVNTNVLAKKPDNIIMAIDVSGSTNSKFTSSMTVLEKEMECVRQYVIANPSNTYFLYTFEENAKYYGNIHVLESENFVQLPDLISESRTFTHKVFDSILKNHPKNVPVNKIILLTDGETDSARPGLISGINNLRFSFGSSLVLEIIAISTSDTNFEIGEDKNIPGMDIINMLGNKVDSYMIYNKRYTDIPFTGSLNSTVDKSNVMFLGIQVKGNIVEFMDNLLHKISINKCNINWGKNDLILKMTLCQFGKILSLLFIRLPELHKLHPLLSKIQSTFETPTYTKDRIYNYLEYGFKCAKGRTHIILTDFEQHVKDSSVKRSEFKDAVEQLTKNGTLLNASLAISLPSKSNPICCICEHLDIIYKNFGEYPNSVDDCGNVYFGLDVSPQAIRIALRTNWAKMGYSDSRGAAPVFLVANIMSMMFVNGVDLNCLHMKYLRQLAICQASMSVLISHEKYDDKGCFYHWKNGNLIHLHFSDTKTHVSLSSDERINFLGLPQPLWWALMMSMLGIFSEQLVHYEHSLQSYGIEPDEKSFLAYIRTTFANNITGHFVLDKVSLPKMSVFTLDRFDPNDKIYRFKDHGECVADTWYSEDEINDYVKTNGCVWCHQKPSDSQLELIKIDEPQITYAKPIIVKKVNEDDVRFECRKFRITFIGITGSGKSTLAEMITNRIVGMGGLILNVNADRLSKHGLKGKEMAAQVKINFDEFEMIYSKLKVILIDLCNVHTSTDKIFGLDLKGYTNINFYPNLDVNRFEEYEMWCLNNVLNREMWTFNTLYWLTPVAVGVEKCVKIHNNKASALAKMLKVNRCDVKMVNNMLEKIKPKAESYKRYVDEIDMNAQIELLLRPMISE